MTSVKEVCRDIDELDKVAQKAIRLFFQECYKAGIGIFVTETYRSQARQEYIYAQGRTRPGKVVTWTTSSRHSKRLAWDIGAAQINGNSNIYNINTIKKAGAIAIKLGITWGGTWTKNLDYPHFEVSAKWSIPKGYSLEGAVSIPASSVGKIIMVDAVNKLPKVVTTVDESKLEEENGMTKSIPTVRDMTSSSLRTAAIVLVREAHNAGIINDKKWVEAAEEGTLSIADLAGIQALIGTKGK